MPSAMTKARKGEPAMRFDLVDLQLFIAVADDAQHHQWRPPRPSGAGLRQRADQGPGSRARRRAAQARPPRRRADRGGRKPARSCPGRAPQCRGDARRSRRLCPRREGDRPPARQHLGTVGISAEGAGRLSCASIRISRSTSRSAKAARSPQAIRQPARPISALRPSTPCRTVSSGFLSARTAWCWSPRAQDELANRRQVDFREVVERDFVGLTSFERAACPYRRACGAARRAPALPRAAEQFRRDRPDGRRRHRHRRDAGSRGQTLRALDADAMCPDPRYLGQPPARDLRPQFQGAAAPGQATGGASAERAHGECRLAPLAYTRRTPIAHFTVARPASLMTLAHFLVSAPI